MEKERGFDKLLGKILSVVLCIVLVASLQLPNLALAAESDSVSDGAQLSAEDEYAGTISGSTDVDITTSGTYLVKSGASGDISIADGLDVTLVGEGYTESCAFTCPIECGANVDLTLQNLAQTAPSSGDNIDFTSGDNTLTIEGTILLDHDKSNGCSVIHVPDEGEDGKMVSLTIKGDGTAYIYKNSIGAGIGGNSAELNGEITFGEPEEQGGSDLTIFMKGTKTGAVIGTGGNSSTTSETPSDITFNSGSYYLIGNARGAIIGGSAGSTGQKGGNVYINGGSLSLNVDYSGAAIGGGGFSGGNDAEGGNVFINGGSIRTYIDENATSSWGVDAAGVDDVAITANKTNSEIGVKTDSSGEPYDTVALMEVDTSKASGELSELTLTVDGEVCEVPSLHGYYYVNESAEQSEQVDISSTFDNWVAYDADSADSNLYLYAPIYTDEGSYAEHIVVLGGTIYHYSYDADEGEFSCDSVVQSSFVSQNSESAYAWREASYGTPPDGTEGTDGCHVTIELGFDGQVAVSDAAALVESLDVSGNDNLSFSADGVSVSEDGTALVLEGDLDGALMAGVLTVSVADGHSWLDGITVDGSYAMLEEFTTIPDSGLAFVPIEVVAGTETTCASTTYLVTSGASVRSMNHIVWMSNGTSIISNAGDYSQSTTAHHHSYYSMDAADSASSIVTNASDTLAALGYTLTDNGDGSFTITATTAVAGEVLSAANYSSGFFSETGIAYGEDVTGVASPDVTGHLDEYLDYADATWEWAEDCSSCIATVPCSYCTAGLEVAAAVSSQTTDATCAEAGSTVYTGTISDAEGATYSDVQTVEIAATGEHSYVSEVTTAATCTMAGVTTWTCSVCGDSYTEEIAATGHSFTNYVSNNDATCTQDGTKTASCDKGCGATDTVVDEGSATGHSYEASWTWADDCSSATLTLSCSSGDDTQTVAAAVTSSTAEDGSTVYTATASYGGAEYSDSQTVAAEEEEGEQEEGESDDSYVVEASWSAAGNTAELPDTLVDMIAGYLGPTVTVDPQDDGSYDIIISFADDSASDIIGTIYYYADGDLDNDEGATAIEQSDDQTYTINVDSLDDDIVLSIAIGGAMEGMFTPGADVILSISGNSEEDDGSDGESGDEGSAFLFDDVQNESSYYYEAVYALYDEGYITGYEGGKLYGVGDSMTRVQVVNILYRMAGSPEATYVDGTFSDVSSDKYYASAVAWAWEEGVTTGTDEGEFLPNDSITRQEMFVMVARYINGGTSVAAADADGTLAAFKDAGEVNSYAEEAVAWCVENGLVTGTDSGELDPQDELTREMGATVLYRGMDRILALSEASEE